MGRLVLNENRKDTEIENDCLVSVIIPVFNEIQFLNEAIDSVTNQSWVNLEIIIIDDGSTDGSAEICDEYSRKDSRIRVIHQENGGLSTARNTGLNIATGKYISFLDSDDAYYPVFVETMVMTAVEKEADIVICKYSIRHTTEKMILSNQEKRIEPKVDGGIYDRIAGLRLLADGDVDSIAWNKLYSKKLWENIRYPAGHVYEDVATTYKIINRCSKMCVIDQPLLSHRKHIGSITDKSSKANIIDRIDASAELTSFIEHNTPEIFTEKQLMMRRQSNLQSMIGLYLRYLGDNKKDAFSQCLRKRIIKAGAEIGIRGCQFRTRIGYQMLCSCPWLLRYVYQGYSIVRRLTQI